jgi:hypothetical protein
MVKLERFGGASGAIGVAAIGVQLLLVGIATPDAQALLRDRMRWELATALRLAGGLGIIWFTAGLAARLGRFDNRGAGPAAMVLGAGIMWGFIWLASGLFSSAALALATTYADPQHARVLSILGVEIVMVLTPVVSIAFLTATGAAVLAAPTFPRRYGYMTICGAAGRAVLGTLDWYGTANFTMRIVDFTLLWVVVTSIHLLGATQPSAGAAA